MEIYNTLTRKKETFEPRKDKKVRMFVCGPTVYDYIHIGNARTFVIFDVVAKYLRYRGYDVNYIQNITDIDNKIIERAQKEGADPLEYAKKYSGIFKQDMQALGVTSPEYKNATDHIPEVIKQVQTLLDKGNAYPIENDGIYFDLSTFPDYGKLSGRTAGMADDAVSRIDDSDKKRNRGDFAVWKFSQLGDPSWPAPFGDGRPGWHIEDTSITEKYFGPQYDIHGGGQDLIFPHHEAEIAQQESVSGLKPFVKYWMHSGFLVVNKDQKMSKSAGNLETLHDVLEKYEPQAIRHYLLSWARYQNPLQFGPLSLATAQEGINNLKKIFNALNIASPENTRSGADDFSQTIKTVNDKFIAAMDDDFNIPEAMGFISGFASYLDENILKFNPEQIKQTLDFFEEFNEFLGVFPDRGYRLLVPKEISALAEKREQLRKEEKWEEADKIRAQIEEMGYQVEDTAYGPLISKK